MNGLHFLFWGIEGGALDSRSCAIDPEAHRAAHTMLGYYHVDGFDLDSYFCANQDTSLVALFQLIVGIDQLAEKPVAIRTAKCVHDSSPVIRVNRLRSVQNLADPK
jgi:hypothetical protein